MSYGAWSLAIFAACFTGFTIYALVTGRTSRATRRDDPTGYWLVISVVAVIAALCWWLLSRALASGRPPQLSIGIYAAPVGLYLIANWLRTGEVVFGNNRFPRRGRAQPYWTILFLCLVLVAFFTGILVHDMMRGRL